VLSDQYGELTTSKPNLEFNENRKNIYSNLLRSRFLSNTGTSERPAKHAKRIRDVHDSFASAAESCCNVCPAWIATKDGGATPIKKRKRKMVRYCSLSESCELAVPLHLIKKF